MTRTRTSKRASTYIPDSASSDFGAAGHRDGQLALRETMKNLNRELVSLTERAFRSRSWHGPNLYGALRGVTAAQASWRPHRDRHNIWELVVHAAYWKYRAHRLISDQPPRAFGIKGADWFVRPVEASESAWEADKALLRNWHNRLRTAIAEFDPARLPKKVGKSVHTYWDTITGVAAHDLYHAGQVQLLKRLVPTNG